MSFLSDFYDDTVQFSLGHQLGLGHEDILGTGGDFGLQAREDGGGKKGGGAETDPLRIASAMAGYGNYNQTTPYGSLSFTAPRFDANGNLLEFGSATQNLSPGQQQIFDLQQQANIGGLQEANRRGYGNLPEFLSGDDVQGALFEKQRGLLDPVFQSQFRDAETLAANRGLPLGGEATTGENGLFTGLYRTQNDALQRAALDSTINANSQTLASRGQLFNELQALTGGQSTPSLANFFSPQGSSVGDAFGLSQRQREANQANQAQNTQAAAGLGVALISLLSTKESKENFEPVGGFVKKLKRLSITKWNYKGEKQKHIGPTAEDFRDIYGVGDGKTIHMVDYLGVIMGTLKEMAHAN